MSNTASGRPKKKFEPLDTRNFVPFGNYDELNIENIKDTCERFYKAPIGSCDNLASDRGPSCTRLEQLKGKKYYHIRFLPPGDVVGVERKQSAASEPASPPKGMRCANLLENQTLVPKSVSLDDLLRVGKFVKPKQKVLLHLEQFDVSK